MASGPQNISTSHFSKEWRGVQQTEATPGWVRNTQNPSQNHSGSVKAGKGKCQQTQSKHLRVETMYLLGKNYIHQLISSH